MTALKRLDLDDHSSYKFPRDFRRFILSCTHIATPYISTEEGPIAEMIIKLCGRTLRALEIFIESYYPYMPLTTSLAESAGGLQSLRLICLDELLLWPYPPTLRRLDCHATSVPMAALVLSKLKTPGGLPNLSHLCVELHCEIADIQGAQAAILLEDLAVQCQRRGITFITDRGEGWGEDY